MKTCLHTSGCTYMYVHIQNNKKNIILSYDTTDNNQSRHDYSRLLCVKYCIQIFKTETSGTYRGFKPFQIGLTHLVWSV